ncbi:hypothetical protein [Arthrobacter wenxiniae]|jgi:hypothetical protein|uniref:Uncharacterized protein n=1 Tax=Arthrobacter wenxiniae TaxID=2713570 RepID=A0A7Y7LWP0_9MICC|nr:hypothetical protein [Arthrobacter wenxiniae]NVM93460.1 hypothetical protein [Arthrobacter wenxiniae]
MDILFGHLTTPSQGFSLAFRILGVVIMCAGMALLGRRNEVGWWLAVGSFALQIPAAFFQISASVPVSPAGLLLYLAASWIAPLVGVGAALYGLAWFRKAPLARPLVRDVALRRFRPADVVAPLAVAVVFAVAYLLPPLALSFGLGGSGGLDRFPVVPVLAAGLLTGLLPAGLAGLAVRSRWAWLPIAGSSVASLGGVALAAQGSVLIFLFMAQAALAVFGFRGWGSLRREAQLRPGS